MSSAFDPDNFVHLNRSAAPEGPWREVWTRLREVFAGIAESLERPGLSVSGIASSVRRSDTESASLHTGRVRSRGVVMRDDLARARESMTGKLLAHKAVRRVEQYLGGEETVLRVVSGVWDGKGSGIGVVVLTDRRVLLVRPEFLRTTTRDFPLDAITSVGWSAGYATGTLTLIAAGTSVEITGVSNVDGDVLAKGIREAVSPQHRSRRRRTGPRSIEPDT